MEKSAILRALNTFIEIYQVYKTVCAPTWVIFGMQAWSLAGFDLLLEINASIAPRRMKQNIPYFLNMHSY